MKPNRILLSILAALLTFSVVVPNAEAQQARARQRPFSDWLDAQGTVLGGGGAPIFIVWSENPATILGFIDFTGKLGAWVSSHGGPQIAPTITGNVSERDLPDGTALITVNSDVKDALAFALDGSGVLFGYRAVELAGHPERTPALGSGHFQFKFIIPYPGAPLPDLLNVVGSDYRSIAFHGNAFGPMRAASGAPEGTPGKLLIVQTGLYQANGAPLAADAFPAERVVLRALGRFADEAGLDNAPSEPVSSEPATRTSWGRIKALYR